jgi:uncharacterized membrane protein
VPPRPSRLEDDETSAPDSELTPPWAFRGHDFGRIFALSDGVFAFSMTLLVLGLALPVGTHGPGLRSYLLSSTFVTSLYVYALTFFVIFAWWRAHQLIFSYIRSFNRTLLQLNIVFLLFIAILPFATEALNASGSDAAGAIFFALVQVVAGAALTSLWIYANGPGHLTHRALPKGWSSYITQATVGVPIIFGISIPVALVQVSFAEYLWLAVFAVTLLARHRGRG